MLVTKFGGTSVKDEIAISRLADIIRNKKGKVIVIVSAMSGITDTLIGIINQLKQNNLQNALAFLNQIFDRHNQVCHKLGLSSTANEFINSKRTQLEQLVRALNVLGEISPKSYDMIVSTGEILSSFIVAEYFSLGNEKADHLDSRDVIKSDSNFGESNVDFDATFVLCKKIILPKLKKSRVIVCGGFIASDKLGNTTTLGRGGSDYSAAIIASALQADNLEIWTDVSGIMTSDPRLIQNARIIKELTYTEAAELAYFGAKVLHPKTIQPAVKNQIPVWVKNSYVPDHPGTKIVSKSNHKKIIKAIAFRKNIIVISVNSNRMLGAYGFLSKVFEVFSRYETSVDIVTTSEVSISLTIDDDTNLNKIKTELQKIGDIEIKKDYAIICSVGEGIRDTAGIAAKFFGVLKGINILMVSIGASEVNISIIVKETDLNKAVTLLHHEFFDNLNDKEIFY
jgi:aspartate kinase